MDLNISGVSYEGKWFDFGDGRLKIRPYPASKTNFIFKDGGAVLSGEQGFEKFNYCLESWEGFVAKDDEAKKPIELTEDVKRKVFDFRLGSIKDGDQEITMPDFVFARADELLKGIVAAEKN